MNALRVWALRKRKLAWGCCSRQHRTLLFWWLTTAASFKKCLRRQYMSPIGMDIQSRFKDGSPKRVNFNLEDFEWVKSEAARWFTWHAQGFKLKGATRSL